MPCPIAQTIDEVGEAWSFLILRDVFIGVRRFHDLERRLGISASTLTRRLARLCRRELLEAHAYAERPKRYEYRLTSKGEDLLEVLLALGAWGNRWLTQSIVPVDARTGARLDPVLVDRASGRRLKAGSVALAAGPDAPPVTKGFLQSPRVLGKRAPTLTMEAKS
jgi:DNA-binding HxlR family transcriptional regulator